MSQEGKTDGRSFANIWERGHLRQDDGSFGIQCLNQAWHLSGDVELATRLLANTWRVVASDGVGAIWARGGTGISVVDTTSCDVRTTIGVSWAQSVAFAEESDARR